MAVGRRVATVSSADRCMVSDNLVLDHYWVNVLAVMQSRVVVPMYERLRG